MPPERNGNPHIPNRNLRGEEVFEINGIRDVIEHFAAGRQIKVRAKGQGAAIEFNALVRIDTPQEALYYANGGILQQGSSPSPSEGHSTHPLDIAAGGVILELLRRRRSVPVPAPAVSRGLRVFWTLIVFRSMC